MRAPILYHKSRLAGAIVTTSIQIFFFILSGVRLSPLGTAATIGLSYQPQRIDDGDRGAIGRRKIGKGTEVFGENLTRRQFVHHKSHMIIPGLKPPRWEVGD
jgi:hypothetical protein